MWSAVLGFEGCFKGFLSSTTDDETRSIHDFNAPVGSLKVVIRTHLLYSHTV
jgi:hypothetical protein